MCVLFMAGFAELKEPSKPSQLKLAATVLIAHQQSQPANSRHHPK